MRVLSVVLLALLSVPSVAADSWLCVGERAVFISEKDGQIIDFGKGSADHKYVIRKGVGLTSLGADGPFLKHCIWVGGMPTSCRYDEEGVLWAGFFRLGAKNTFTLTYLTPSLSDNETMLDVLMKGKCSPLD